VQFEAATVYHEPLAPRLGFAVAVGQPSVGVPALADGAKVLSSEQAIRQNSLMKENTHTVVVSQP